MSSSINLKLPKGTKIPNHIALIPDGNRRWARSRGIHTLLGHKKGFEMAVELGRTARSWGIHTVSLWGFSTENWERTNEEIRYLMKMYGKLLDDYLEEADRDSVKIVHLGRKDRIPKFLLNKINYAQDRTKDNTSYITNLAIDYGGQDDILRAVKEIVADGVDKSMISKDLVDKYIDLRNQPYPYVDLMIRTSGEQRTSGFLLWNSAYAEYYWENDHFPDFTPEKLRTAIVDYSRRRRRYGGNDAEEHFNFKPEVIAAMELNWWRLTNIPNDTKFRDYAIAHVKEQFGLAKSLAKEAGILMSQAVIEGNKRKWEKAKLPLKRFYRLIKDEIKLAFEPSLVATLQVNFWREINETKDINASGNAEDIARNLYAEVYRISLLQAAKVAHLCVLANIEKNLAKRGYGDEHWIKAENYLQMFYSALKERVA
jgi:undecaprenyl diphosphate synthase